MSRVTTGSDSSRNIMQGSCCHSSEDRALFGLLHDVKVVEDGRPIGFVHEFEQEGLDEVILAGPEE